MKNVLILFGGNSYEHEISLKSVNFVIENIDTNKINYRLVGIDFDNTWYEIKSNQHIDNTWKSYTVRKIDNIINYCGDFDIILPMIHGNDVENGKLQSLFELYNINYVGCDSYSSLISYDKLLTKLILEKYNIPQIPYYIYNEKLNLKNIEYPVIIKPCKCGSSIGISVAYNKTELITGIKLAKKYDNNILIEKYIEKKRELECAVLEKNKKLIISDVGEILKENSWYDFESKYKNNTKTIISNIDKNIKEEIKKYTKCIFEILKCKDLSRVDFLYDLNSQRLYFNEINTMPGFTNISMYPILIKNAGINYKKMLNILLDT